MSKKRYVPWGRTLSTYDNYLGKQKTGSKKERPVVVVDTHKENLAVVPLSSRAGESRTELKGYNNNKKFKDNKKKNQKTYYKHYLEIEDNEGKPIQINQKFRANHKNMDVPYDKIIEIKNVIFNKAKQKQRNRKLFDKFKGKKNDWD